MGKNETHEPLVPVNWPDGHVGVELTSAEVSECVMVRIHGHKHYLHATTAEELLKMLCKALEEFDAKMRASFGGRNP